MRKKLKILLLASALLMLAGGLFGPIYAVFVEQIGGDLLTAGGAYAAFAIASGVLIFFISRWEDHVKHKEKLIIAGYALSSIGFLGYLFIKTPIHLFIVQAILGMGEAVSSPAFDGLYSKNLQKGKFASEWGLWESLYYTTIGIAAIIGGFLAQEFGFKVLFVVMFLFSLSGLISSLFLLRKKNNCPYKLKKNRKI